MMGLFGGLFSTRQPKIDSDITTSDRKMILKLLKEIDPTRTYRPAFRFTADTLLDDLPFFRLWYAQLMERDTSCLLGIELRNAVLSIANVEITGDRPDVVEYVQRQWDILWGKFWHVFAETKKWGFLGTRIEYQDGPDGLPEVSHVKDFFYRDARPLIQEGRPAGMQLRRLKANADLWNPRGAWFTHLARHGLFYGESIYRNAFGEWWELHMDGGALKIRQKRMIADACRGDVVWAPTNTSFKDDEGNPTPVMEIVRSNVENVQSGGTYVFPSDRDGSGNKLFELEFAHDLGDPVAIFKWNDDLNEKILMALGILPEVVKAQATGSGFSGRSIPLMMTIQSVQREFQELLIDIDRQILRPLAILVLGGEPGYQIKPTQLLEEFTEDVSAGMTPGQSGGLAGGMNPGGQPTNGQPQQFAAFVEAEHPRGQPENKGQFVKGSGSATATKEETKEEEDARLEAEERASFEKELEQADWVQSLTEDHENAITLWSRGTKTNRTKVSMYNLVRTVQSGSTIARDASGNNVQLTKEDVKLGNKLIDQLEDAIKDAPVPEGDLFRGLGTMSESRMEELTTIGSTITMRAMSSFSSSQKVADNFIEEGGVLLRIKNPKTGANIEKLSHLPNEKEILVKCCPSYRVVSVGTFDVTGGDSVPEVVLEEI